MSSPAVRAGLAAGLLLTVCRSPASAEQALILADSGRPTIIEGATALADMLAARGFDVVIEEPLPGTDLGDLTPNACVWDLRVDFALSTIEADRLRAVPQAGKGLYFSGEHGSFDVRNASVNQFIIDLGGGLVDTTLDPPPGVLPVDVVEEINQSHFTAYDCQPLCEVVYDGVDNGEFSAAGNGTILTTGGGEVGSVVWDEGALLNAPEGRLIYVLDINYLSDGPTGTLDFRVEDRTVPTQNRAFVENIIMFLCDADCCIDPMPPALPCLPASPMSPSSADLRLPRAPRSACSAISAPTSG